MSSFDSKILIVDDDHDARNNLKRILEECKGIAADTAESYREASFFISKTSYDVIITDMRMETKKSGMDVLSLSSQINPATRVIVISAYDNTDEAFLAGELGMFAYISKIDDDPYDKIVKKVEKALIFDAFVSYKNDDQNAVRSLCNTLKNNGLRIWVDYERVTPGANWLDSIQKAISLSRSGILVFGEKGVGKWQKTEIELLIQLANSAAKKIIPVLLPGVDRVPTDFPFLESYHRLQLNPCIYTGCVFDQLVSSIFGPHRWYRRFGQRI